MAIRITADIDTSKVSPLLRRYEQRIKSATATALTRTAADVRKGWQGQLRTRLDRPTPYTVNAVRYESASKDSLTSAVIVREDGNSVAPAEYLGTQQRGGQRNLRKFERALVAGGAMPEGSKVVPARFALVDGYGNISKAQIVSVLRQFGSELSRGYQRVISRNATRRAGAIARGGRKYVAIRDERTAAALNRPDLFPGVWERRGDSLVPVFRYINVANYTQKIDLYGGARDIVSREIQKHFERELARISRD